jgi:hypothetical protein
MDVFQEKQIRRTLDELAHLHHLSSLGQLPPEFLTVRVYALDEDPVQIDLNRIRNDIATKCSGKDILFEIRMILIPSGGQSASAFIIPWEQLQNVGATLQKRKVDLMNLSTSMLDGIDPMAIARDLGMQPDQPSSPES